MIKIIGCEIDSVHAYGIEISNPDSHGNGPIVTAKIGYRVGDKPLGGVTVTVNDMEQYENVVEAAKILIENIEKAFAPKIGIIHETDSDLITSEPPPGITF
ncbi:MAG: hypothetical protein CL582_21780 [Alteromonadaceae bacterium]|nr:hypothetical protein [Alteromonadaceae bacterium]|tara:strand:+ start:5595 stop:5897 length:303 start_codon:yes stop_codon:yes gene_type:complete